MNKNNIQAIFKKYIDNFNYINNKENNESYKWEIIKKFQEFDIDAENFAEMLNQFCKVTGNLVDSSQQLPFYALVAYARKEPETVRKMFKKLYANEYIDDIEKQKLIDEFIESSEQLRRKYYPESRLYVNNQRSVMMYLFLRYPNSNYGYKASQAKNFADCIEFYEDWGPMTNFKLSTFNRMCNQLVEEIKLNKDLIDTHKSRYEDTSRIFHLDEEFHILAMDIIFSSQTYNFYDGMVFSPINAQSRKIYFENVKKAQEVASAFKKAKADMNILTEAKKYVEINLTKGSAVKHKKFGKGVIEECSGNTVSISFPEINDTKKLNLVVSVSNGIMVLFDEKVTDRVKEYATIMGKETAITTAFIKAESTLQSYIEYLD